MKKDFDFWLHLTTLALGVTVTVGAITQIAMHVVWAADPVDVSPVQLPRNPNLCSPGQLPDSPYSYCQQPYFTCADKRRVLLISEDGKRHCFLITP